MFNELLLNESVRVIILLITPKTQLKKARMKIIRAHIRPASILLSKVDARRY